MNTVWKQMRAILLSAVCLLFTFQINNNIPDLDLAPQFEKPHAEQIVEYEDQLYPHQTRNSQSALAEKKRHWSQKPLSNHSPT